MTLSTLSDSMQSLAKLGVLRSFRKGAVILNEGESGDAIYILIKGRVRVFGSSISGKEITFGHIEAGDYFGEMSLDGGTRSASVEAVEPCQCVVVDNMQVIGFMQHQHDFAVSLIHKTIARARAATQSACDMALMDVYARLTKTLNNLAGVKRGDSYPQTIPNRVTHAELAGLVGASREMVSKLMKDLESGGYFKLENRQISLLKKLPSRW